MGDIQKGDRVALVRTSDEHTRLKPGDQGQVTRVNDERGEIHVRWDGGSSLTMLTDEGDEVRKVQ